jgi:UDP-sulfoquinovose synthase
MKPQSFYHLSKAADSLNLAFACRVWGLRATDLNQGVVYGTDTNETNLSEELNTSFHYDHLFGTVINRFLVEASENIPLTIYGGGEQKRTFLNIKDTLKCVELALKNPAKKGEYKVRNQFTEIFSIKELANKVFAAGKNIGIKVKINNIKNPRVEMSKHYYEPSNKSFIKIGLKPTLLKIKYLEEQILKIKNNKNRKIIRDIISPNVQWNQKN